MQHVAEILHTIKGPEDFVSRHGGDEFLMLIPHIRGKDKIIFMCEELLNYFKRPFQDNGHEIYVTASIGFSLYPDDGLDLAMYLAKSGGRNRYVSYKSM